MSIVLELAAVSKTFTMHLQGGTRLPVVAGVEFAVDQGECAVLAGPSGGGTSSSPTKNFGKSPCDAGSMLIHQAGGVIDVAARSRARFSRCARAASAM